MGNCCSNSNEPEYIDPAHPNLASITHNTQPRQNEFTFMQEPAPATPAASIQLSQTPQESTGKTEDSTIDSADDYFFRGNYLSHHNKFEAAEEAFNQCLAVRPTFGKAFYHRGLMFLETGNSDKALADFESALQGGYLLGFLGRGRVRAQRNEYDLALQDLDTTLANRVDGVAYRVRAQVHEALGHVAEAERDAEKAEELFDKECVICMDAPRSTRLRPCHHVVMCHACADGCCARRFQCPVCSQAISRVEYGDFFGATYNPSISHTDKGNPIALMQAAAKLAENIPLDALEALSDQQLQALIDSSGAPPGPAAAASAPASAASSSVLIISAPASTSGVDPLPPLISTAASSATLATTGASISSASAVEADGRMGGSIGGLGESAGPARRECESPDPLMQRMQSSQPLLTVSMLPPEGLDPSQIESPVGTMPRIPGLSASVPAGSFAHAASDGGLHRSVDVC